AARWWVRGDLAVDSGSTRLYGASSEITSDDNPVPDYHFSTGQMKWLNKNVMVARPAVLYIHDVPIMWLPFIFQDVRRGRRSGIRLGWQHQQSFSSRTSFNASVDYATSTTVIQNNTVNPYLATASLGSQMSFNKQFDWGTLNIGGSRRQEIGSGLVTQNFPNVSLTPSDRKSTRLNSSHLVISYAVFCLKKKKKKKKQTQKNKKIENKSQIISTTNKLTV